MNGYLGEFPAGEDNPYVDYTKEDWILYYIECYGQIDGVHHKQWVIDQIARIVQGTFVDVKLAKWSLKENPQINPMKYEYFDSETVGEYRISLHEPSQRYLDWVNIQRGEYDEEYDEYTYYYNEGTAP